VWRLSNGFWGADLSFISADGGDALPMGIGTSLFLIAVGAILYFAVNADISGIEISTIGIILMVIGVVGLLISLFMLQSARRDGRTTVVRDRDVY
jgi:beta-lactamase regulating signal transducer with metallopeptidase domain